MAALHRVAVAALGQQLERVLTDRLQHPEPRVATGHWLGPKQIVVQERVHAVGDIELAISGDGRATFKGEPADENGETCEERLLVHRQEVVAPSDRGAQRPMALGNIRTRLGLQKLEPAGRGDQDLARREQLDACRRELECERQSVEAHAECGDRLGVHLRERELGPRVAHAIHE